MNLFVTAALLIPPSFWNSFYYTIPLLICETPYWVQHRVVITPSDYRIDNVLEAARRFSEKCRDVPLAVLYMAPRGDHVLHYPVIQPRGFENWRHNLELWAKDGWPPVPEIAQVVVIEGQAVVRIRRKDKVSRIVLGKNDPLKIAADGQVLEILGIHGDLTGREVKREYEDGGLLSISQCEDCVSHFDIAVRTTGPLRLTALKEVVRTLSQLKVPSDLRISLRRDAWFAPSLAFPWVYVFDQVIPRLPTKAEYARDGQLGAYVDRRRREVRYFDYAQGKERLVETESIAER